MKIRIFLILCFVFFYGCTLPENTHSTKEGNVEGADNGNIIYVSITGNDANSGTRGLPKLTIQEAIYSAKSPCEIHVSSGVYEITSSIIMKNGVSILGGYSSDFDTRNIELNTTMITDMRTSGEINYYTVYCSAINGDTKIEGFTITGTEVSGNAKSYCIYNTASNPLISKNKLLGRGTNDFSFGINNESSNPVISDNLISGGCGIRNAYSNPKISCNEIYGSGIDENLDCGNLSYGINNLYSSPAIYNNIINGGNGGKLKWFSHAIFNDTNSSPDIMNNTINGGTGKSYAYGILNDKNCHPKIINNIVFSTSISGVGINEVNTGCDPASVKNNCIFACQNGLYIDNGSVTITSIDDPVSTNEGTATLKSWGNINDGSMSMFNDYSKNDYHLKYAVPDNVREGGIDLSAFFTNDKDGSQRTIELNSGVTNPGASGWSMGAYEEDSGSKKMISFGIKEPKVTGVVDENAKTVSLAVPEGTDITKLTAVFETTGTSVTIGSIIQSSGITENDFSKGTVIYRIYASDNTSVDYKVNILSNEKKLTGFIIANPHVTAVIDEVKKTITATVNCSDISSLTAYFTSTGKYVYVGSTQQVSGITINDFRNPVIYRLIAEDGSEADYTATISRTSYKSISKFSFSSPASDGIINDTAKTIFVPVPYGTDVRNLIAIYNTDGVEVNVNEKQQTSGLTSNNFSDPVEYRIIAADESEAIYTVTVVPDSSNIETISSVKYKASSVIDNQGKIHICYYDSTNGEILYATNKSGDWTQDVVTKTISNSNITGIAIDASGFVHIGFVSYGVLKHSTNSSGLWTSTDIDSAGVFICVTSDAAGGIYFGYYDFTNAHVKYASVDGTGTINRFDTGISGGFMGIAVDSNKHVYMCYIDALGLNCMSNTGGTWQSSVIDGNNNGNISMTVDSSDIVHIAYYDNVNKDLKYATNVGGTWNNVTVDSAGDVGLGMSITFDANNKLHVSYYDSTNTSLKYATNAGGGWSYSTMDNNGNVGMYSNIAVDCSNPANNRIHIVYTGHNGLKHMTIN
jgi:hypothetical protein